MGVYDRPRFSAGFRALAAILVTVAAPDVRSQCVITDSHPLLASDAAPLDLFGLSLSLFEDAAVIGAPDDDDSGASSGSAYVRRWNGLDWVEEQKLVASDAASGDRFGKAVAIKTPWIVVGAPQNADAGSSSGSVYVFQFNGVSWQEVQKLKASDGAADDQFGFYVSMDGDRIVVGSPFDDDHGSSSGAAYVFRLQGGTWVEEQKLRGDADSALASFGYSASMNGERILIGAPARDPETGAAFVFKRGAARWYLEQKILASDGAAGDLFGRAVSLSGDWAAVGAVLDDDVEENAGSAYVFRFSGVSWEEKQKLAPPSLSAGAFFGVAVSVCEEDLYVGAHQYGGYPPIGRVFSYEYDGAAWQDGAVFGASDSNSGQVFGSSVSASGDRLLAGAFQKYSIGGGDRAGAAYVFDRRCDECPRGQRIDSTTGENGDKFGDSLAIEGALLVVGASQEGRLNEGSAFVYAFDSPTERWKGSQKLKASDAEASDRFGAAVALDGNVAAIGTPSGGKQGAPVAGAAYVFRFDGMTWIEEQELNASDASNYAFFGTAVDIDGDVIVVGAPYGDTVSGQDTGSAYILRFNGATWDEEAKLSANDAVTGALFGESVAVQGPWVVIGAPGALEGAVKTGACYVFRYSAGVWSERQKLVAADRAAGDAFGKSVAMDGVWIAVGAPLRAEPGYEDGAVYLFRNAANQWDEKQKLFVTDDLYYGEQFGHSVAIEANAIVVGAPLDRDLESGSGALYVYRHGPDGWVWQAKILAEGEMLGDQFGESVAMDGDTVLGANSDYFSEPGYAYVAYVPELELGTNLTSVSEGGGVAFSTCGGGGGAAGMLAIVDVNGAPVFGVVALDVFDARNEWVLSEVVPPGLSGYVLTFQSFGFARSGNATATNRRTVQFN